MAAAATPNPRLTYLDAPRELHDVEDITRFVNSELFPVIPLIRINPIEEWILDEPTIERRRRGERRGETGKDEERRGETRRDEERRGETRRDEERRGELAYKSNSIHSSTSTPIFTGHSFIRSFVHFLYQ